MNSNTAHRSRQALGGEQKGERRRKRAWWLGALFGFVGVMLLFCTFPCLEPFYARVFPDLWSQHNPSVSRFNPSPQPFDRAKWQRGYATDRMAMAKWLAGRGTMVGMNREQATAMLGPQDSEFDHQGIMLLNWKLGRLDDNSLFDSRGGFILSIDGTGTVVKAEVFFDD